MDIRDRLRQEYLERKARKRQAVRKFAKEKAARLLAAGRDDAAFRASWKNMIIMAEKFRNSKKTILGKIIHETVRRHDVTKLQLKSMARTKRIAIARHEVCWRGKQAGCSLTAIGRALGNRNHATILSGQRRYERLMSIKRGARHLITTWDKKINMDLIL